MEESFSILSVCSQSFAFWGTVGESIADIGFFAAIPSGPTKEVEPIRVVVENDLSAVIKLFCVAGLGLRPYLSVKLLAQSLRKSWMSCPVEFGRASIVPPPLELAQGGSILLPRGGCAALQLEVRVERCDEAGDRSGRTV